MNNVVNDDLPDALELDLAGEAFTFVDNDDVSIVQDGSRSDGDAAKLSSQKVLSQVHRQIVLQIQKWPSAKWCPKCDLQHAHRQVSPVLGQKNGNGTRQANSRRDKKNKCIRDKKN